MFLISFDLDVLIIMIPITYLNDPIDHSESYSLTDTVPSDSLLDVYGKRLSESGLILARFRTTVVNFTISSVFLFLGLDFSAFSFATTFWLRCSLHTLDRHMTHLLQPPIDGVTVA